MSFHMLANFSNLVVSTNGDLPALTDQIISIRNSHHTPSSNVNLIAAAAFSAQITRARINTARFQSIDPNYILPVARVATLAENPQIADFTDRPLLFAGDEEIIWELTTDTSTADAWVLSLIQERREIAPTGEVYTLVGTSTTTATDSAWTDITMTWDFRLPAGIYAVIGGVYYAATAKAFRVLFEGQQFRPGGIGLATEGQFPWAKQLNGNLGQWGRFRSSTLPQIQVLNSAAVAAHTIYLQVVRVS